MRYALRVEFEGSHAALAHIGQAVERGDFLLRDAMRGHPRIDEGVTEGVGKRVGEQAGETVEREFWQIGKKDDVGAVQWERKRSEFDAGALPGRRVLKRVV